MKKKNMIGIIIIILAIILAMSYIVNLKSNSDEITNNTSNFSQNGSGDKVNLNNDSAKDNNQSNENSNENSYHPVNKNHKTNKKKSNNTHDEALMAKRTIEKYALDKNEIAGFPVYKDKRMGLWLVPIFDKKTNKFKGSIYVSDGSIFIMGPGSYSEYKKIISGKTGHKSDTNKKHKTDKSNSNISNKSQSKKIVVTGKSNFDISSNSNKFIVNEQQNMNFEESVKSDLNQQDINIECNTQLNATS